MPPSDWSLRPSESGLAHFAPHERDSIARTGAIARGASDLGAFASANHARLHACASGMAKRSHEKVRSRGSVPKSENEPEKKDSELVGASES
jgi:hypothetical protein